jgi:hypothetical protein
MPDGSSFKGTWKGTLLNGNGVYTAADGTSYEGNWVDGALVGEVVVVDVYGNRTTVSKIDMNPLPRVGWTLDWKELTK